jgi:hypothetical protein
MSEKRDVECVRELFVCVCVCVCVCVRRASYLCVSGHHLERPKDFRRARLKVVAR